MRFIKKIDIFVFKAFSLLFVGTFFICLFIFMMQFMWRYVDELIGKGLTMDVLAQFFYYTGLTLVPMSLPMAVLLASLITFGNFGERLELLSMKAAGIPLIRILQPIFLFTCLLSIGSFYFQNVTAPKAQKNFYALFYSMKQKSPELEIPEGIFYSEIPGYNIFVEEKNKDNGMLYGVMIYSTTDGYEDAQIVLADSAKIETTADESHLLLTMYAGERFRNMQTQGGMKRTNVPYMRETFIKETDLIPFNNDFNMMDANVFSGNAQTKNLEEINAGIDSLTHRSDSTGRALFAYMEKSTLKRRTFLTPKDSIKFATQKYDIDAKYNQLSINERHNIMRNAMQKSMIASNEYEFRSLVSKDLNQATRGHWVEWHKKFTLSLACLLFFFIGAPLGAIIRKGGLGVPVVISVVIFIFYYIVNASGDKMAKSGEWVVWFGEWLSTMVLLPLGAFLTYKANKDSAVFNIEAYIQVIRRILGLRVSRNVTRKEVIIYDPDYAKVCQDISLLTKDWNNYEQKVRLRFPPHYIRLFFYKIDDQEVSVLNERMEEIISTLCNSRDAMILASINKIPVLATHAHTRPFHNYKWNMVLGVIFPLGVFFYFRIWNYRIRLYKDIKQIQKNFDFINERIDKILDKK